MIHERAYWGSRHTWGYYTLVKAWLTAISASSLPAYIGATLVPMEPTERLSLLDVGCLDTPVAMWGHFSMRYTVDIKYDPMLPGVRSFVEDFLTWNPPHRMTVVTCLQVLEHLPDDVMYAFATKLRSISDYTIVSVPYMWRAGLEPDHKQDPIDLAKFTRMMGKAPDEHAIILDTKHHRIVGRWNNTLP